MRCWSHIKSIIKSMFSFLFKSKVIYLLCKKFLFVIILTRIQYECRTITLLLVTHINNLFLRFKKICIQFVFWLIYVNIIIFECKVTLLYIWKKIYLIQLYDVCLNYSWFVIKSYLIYLMASQWEIWKLNFVILKREK